ncbi:MAG: type VII secretion target [Actinomycetota bacterium]|nr:type VII secretion target [Actinomycetota bacterium]
MAELNVNPGQLLHFADAYSELATRAGQISPQAAAEVQRIAATHGPMGYPTAVGIAAGLAKADAPLQATVADFNTYAQRFSQHTATYTKADQVGADALDNKFQPVDSTDANDQDQPKPAIDPRNPFVGDERFGYWLCWLKTLSLQKVDRLWAIGLISSCGDLLQASLMLRRAFHAALA